MGFYKSQSQIELTQTGPSMKTILANIPLLYRIPLRLIVLSSALWASTALAQVSYSWNPSGAGCDDQITTSSCWTPEGIPTDVDSAEVNDLAGLGNNLPFSAFELAVGTIELDFEAELPTLTQSDGTVTLTQFLSVAAGPFGGGTVNAKYHLQGGTLQVPEARVGDYGDGVFQQDGGLFQPDFLYVGNYGFSAYSMNGGTLTTTFLLQMASQPIPGDGFGGVVTNFFHNGGNVSVGRNLWMGDGNPVDGVSFYHLTGGSLEIGTRPLNSNGYIRGAGDRSILELNGGILNVRSPDHGIEVGYLIVGADNANVNYDLGGPDSIVDSGLITVSSEYLAIDAIMDTNGIYPGEVLERGNNATAAFNQSSGVHTIYNGLNIGAGGTFNLSGGVLDVDTVAQGGTFSFTGGQLAVSHWTGDLVNSGGELLTGRASAAGTTAVSGGFSQTAGALVIEIGGLDAGVDFDQLSVGGSAVLGGSLNVVFINDFVPAPNDEFDVLTAETLAGSFDTLNLPAIGPYLTWQTEYLIDAVDTTDVVRLRVVAEANAPVDLAITKTNGAPFVDGTATYTIEVTNNSPFDLRGVGVEDILPTELDAGNAAWSCIPAGSAICTVSGTGDLIDTVDLPGGESVTYTLSAPVLASEGAMIVNTATVSTPAGLTDTTPADNTATDDDRVALFMDGLEEY